MGMLWCNNNLIVMSTLRGEIKRKVAYYNTD